MSFKDMFSWLDQLISRQNDFFYNTMKNYQAQLQDIYCWLEKSENQFKSCGCKLDSTCLAANLACNLTGLAETFYFSLEPETRNDFDLLSTALKSRFFSDDLKWLLRQLLTSRQHGFSESLDSYINFIDSTYRRLGVSQVDQFYYFVNGLRADIKREVLMGQPKDYLTAVNLARHTESVDRTIGDSHSSFQLCNLLCDDLCQEIHDGIESLRESICPNLGSRDRNHQSPTQSYRRRYTGGFTPQGPICFKCGVVGHKARNCTSQPHRYYSSEPRRKTPSHHDTRLVSNPVKHFSTSIKCIGSSPFVLKQEVSSLSRENKLKIPKTIEYNFEVRECSLLTEIVVAVDKDIDPNLTVETSFEVFTPPKSFYTPVITLTEKKILQAQEVSFIEISVDQYQVCELEENANYIVDDVQNVYAAQVFDAFTVSVFYFARDFENRTHPVSTLSLGFAIGCSYERKNDCLF